MGIGKHQVRAIFTVKRDTWRRLQRLRAEYGFPHGTYSAVVDQALTTLLQVIEGGLAMKGKDEKEQRVEFYRLLTQVLGDQTGMSRLSKK